MSTLGSLSCYCLSWALGKQLAHAVWPGQLERFAAEVTARRGEMFNYIVFLRVTPLLPNTFINVASPIVGVPLGPFTLGALGVSLCEGVGWCIHGWVGGLQIGCVAGVERTG